MAARTAEPEDNAVQSDPLMRRWSRRRAQVEREQQAARIIRHHDAALRDRLLARLAGLLDALRRERAA